MTNTDAEKLKGSRVQKLKSSGRGRGGWAHTGGTNPGWTGGMKGRRSVPVVEIEVVPASMMRDTRTFVYRCPSCGKRAGHLTATAPEAHTPSRMAASCGFCCKRMVVNVDMPGALARAHAEELKGSKAQGLKGSKADEHGRARTDTDA